MSDGEDPPERASLRARLAHSAPLIAGVALAAPTLLARYPPMNDLPLHEGVVGVLRHFGDETYFPNGLYTLNPGHPNQLFHAAAWLFSLVVPTGLACRLVIALAQIAIMWTAARFADHLGRSRWGALLVAPLALGFTYYWGLVANLVGFAAFLFALPTLDRAAERPTARALLQACGMLLLVYAAHESLFAAATGVIIVLAVCQRLTLRQTTLRLTPAAAAVVLAGVHQYLAARMYTPSIKSSSATTLLPLTDKLVFFPTVLFGSHDLPAQLLLLGLAGVAIAAMMLGRSRDPADEAEPVAHRLEALQIVLHRYRFEAIGFVLVLGYFVLPFSWRGATLLHERFLAPGWALLVICAAPRLAAPVVAKLAAAVLPAGILLLSWPQFFDVNATYTDLDALMAAIPRGSAVASCTLKTRVAAARIYSSSLGPARSLAVVGGRAGMSLAISPISPVQIAREYRWDDYDVRTVQNGARGFVPAHDLTRFGYLIVQANEIATQRLLVGALAPDADLVEARGEWILFRSKHDILPLTAPATVPDPRLESLFDRVAFLARQSDATP